MPSLPAIGYLPRYLNTWVPSYLLCVLLTALECSVPRYLPRPAQVGRSTNKGSQGPFQPVRFGRIMYAITDTWIGTQVVNHPYLRSVICTIHTPIYSWGLVDPSSWVTSQHLATLQMEMTNACLGHEHPQISGTSSLSMVRLSQRLISNVSATRPAGSDHDSTQRGATRGPQTGEDLVYISTVDIINPT